MEKYVLKKRIEKIVISGNVVEYFRYKNPIAVERDDSKTPDPFKQFYRNFDEEGKREDNIYAARANLRRTIWCNVTEYSKFLTLTYKETVLDTERVFYDWKQFIKQLRRKGYNPPYLYVLEHQTKRGILENNAGSFHIHAVLFFDEKIPYQVINKCWPHGSTDIHVLKDVNNVGAYVSKYLTKETLVELHKKSYHVSRGLKKPVVLAQDGYLGTYGDKYGGLFQFVDFKYQNVQNFSCNGFENSILYSQGVINNSCYSFFNDLLEVFLL